MRCGHLFNGIGGFALAASWMGWENIFHCEIDERCNKVMRRHFPNSIEHGNIKEQNFTDYAGTVELISGGFRCQPYSIAGARKGKNDHRHLWPEMLRAIREIYPRWVVGENVRGLTNWNGGVVFDEVQADLEAEGYEVLPFLLPAAGVGAPHRRDRIWFIAHVAGGNDKRIERKICGADGRQEGDRIPTSGKSGIGLCEKGTTSNSNSGQRCKGRLYASEPEKAERHTGSLSSRIDRRPAWHDFPTQSAICRGDDGVPDRMDRIAELGNAIVPQIALQIFQSIELYDQAASAQKNLLFK